MNDLLKFSKLIVNFKKTCKSTGCNFKEGITSFKLDCKVCKKYDADKHLPQAFVNKKTGTFLCPTCEFSSPFDVAVDIYEGKKDLSDVQQFFQPNFKSRFVVSSSTTNMKSDSFLENNLFSSLDECLFKNLQVKFNPENNLLCFPLKNFAGRIVGEKLFNIHTQEEETYPNTKCSGLIMHSWSMPSKKAVLVLNLPDFFALIKQKLNEYTIICLPHKLQSLPQECLPLLENFKELIFWFDIDTIGWDLARNFAQKLNEKRCSYIRPTHSNTTPYNALKNNINLKNILQLAEPLCHKHITTFPLIKHDILSELQNIEKVNGVKWTRFPILNKLLKGHRKGELTILTGPTGCGKTTFMSEYSLDLAQQGVSTLWGSFEIRNTRLATTLLRQFVGYPLEDKLNEFDSWAESFEKFPIYFMTFHGQQSIKLVMDAVEHAQYIHDIQHVIIDNVQFMMGVSAVMKSDKFWEQDAIISAFRKFATVRNVHVTLVMHPRKEKDDDLTTNSIFGGARASQEADNILIIQDKRLVSVKGRKCLQVVKNRYCGELGMMPLTFDKKSLSFATKPATIKAVK